jgi:hypothetical protein
MLIAVGNFPNGCGCIWRTWLAHLVGALGLAHLAWRTWLGALGLATLAWQPWFGSLPRGELGLAALRDGTLGHGTLGDGNQSLAFLGRHSCRDVVPSPHVDLAHCWLAHLVWRTQTWRSWMRRSSQGEWLWQFGTGPQQFAAHVFGALA